MRWNPWSRRRRVRYVSPKVLADGYVLLVAEGDWSSEEWSAFCRLAAHLEWLDA